MMPLVSIILPPFEDDTYLVRCLNMIRRQSYKETEIILLDYEEREKLEEYKNINFINSSCDNFWDRLNDAVNNSRGDYFLFCDVTTVMAPNTIELLLEKNQPCCNQTPFYIGQLLQEEKNTFVMKENSKWSLLGKIFNAEYVKSKQELFHLDSKCPDIQFVLEYASQFDGVKYDERIYLYGSDENIAKERNGVATENSLSHLLSLYQRMNNEEKDLKGFLQDILDHSDGIERFMIAKVFAVQNLSEYERHYEIAKKYLIEEYKKIIETENEESFLGFKDYIQIFTEDELLYDQLLKLMGLDDEAMEIGLKNPVSKFKFYLNHREPKQKAESLETVLGRIEELREQQKQTADILGKKIAECNSKVPEINKLVKVVEEIAAEKKTVAEAETKVLSGPALADYLVSVYGNGGLGLKTLVRAFVAWVKFKL